MKYNLTKLERETHISWDMQNRVASIDTAEPATIHKLDKLVQECPETYRLVREDERYGAKRYEVPASYIRFGKPPTEAQKDAYRRKAVYLPRNSPGHGAPAN